MKLTARLFFLLLFVFALPGRGFSQGCALVMQPNYSSYTSFSFDDASNNIYSTAVVDGTTTIGPSAGCNWQSFTHQGRVYNQLGSVGGWVYGAQVSPISYISVSNSQQIVGVPGVVYTTSSDSEVICSGVGTLFSTSSAGSTRFVQAYYYGSTGSKTYHRCNPIGDACDTVYLVNSPVTDGSWPPFGLFNAVYVNTGIVNLCIVGRHGVRADMCIKPDPHP